VEAGEIVSLLWPWRRWWDVLYLATDSTVSTQFRLNRHALICPLWAQACQLEQFPIRMQHILRRQNSFGIH
jgi:hypothetical protein